jgi:hypothetical protein
MRAKPYSDIYKKFFLPAGNLISGIVRLFRNSGLARILLIIVLIKFIVFYGFLKGFLYPRYLKPQYESDNHRSEEVMRDLLHIEKPIEYDREH